MTGIITRAQIPGLMYVGAAEAFFDFKKYPAEWKNVFYSMKSGKAQEFFIEVAGPGYAQAVKEAQTVGGGTIKQTYTTNLENQTYEQNVTISYEASQDIQYPEVLSQKATMLRNSIVAAENTFAFATFNTAFDAMAPIADGQALCSIAHPTLGGTYSNLVAGVDVSILSLSQAYIQSQEMLDPSGLKIMNKPKAVLYSHKLGPTMQRLLESRYIPGSNNNDVNPAFSWFPKGGMSSHFMDDVPNSAFILMDNNDSFVHVNRQDVEISVNTHPDTRAIKTAAFARGCWGAKDGRGCVGIKGS